MGFCGAKGLRMGANASAREQDERSAKGESARLRQEELDEELMSAILLNDPEAVRSRVGAGASVSALHRRVMSAPGLAARADAPLALEELLRLGACARELSGDGREPIHYCCDDGRPEAMGLLLAFGADPNAPDSHGRPALHMAVAAEQVECARLLLSSGARVGERDQYGETALSAAVRRSDERMVRALLEGGADPADPGGLKESPLQMCARRVGMGLDDGPAAAMLAALEQSVISRSASDAGKAPRAKGL